MEETKQKCRICGCTDDECTKCIRITGKPCHWVEPNLCSACADAIQANKNQNDMNFFKQLAGLENVDMTIRIMKKNDKLTLNIMPGSGSATIQPILVTGTPDELDSEFFKTIAPDLKEITGIVTNIESVKKEAEQKKEEATKAAAAKKEEKKPEKKPADKKETKKPAAEKKETSEKIGEPNLFAEAQ